MSVTGERAEIVKYADNLQPGGQFAVRSAEQRAPGERAAVVGLMVEIPLGFRVVEQGTDTLLIAPMQILLRRPSRMQGYRLLLTGP